MSCSRSLRPYTVPLWNAVAMVQDTGTYSYVLNNPAGYSSVIFRVKIASEVGTSTFDFKVQAWSQTANEYNDIAGASLAQLTSATSTDLVIGTGLTAVANRVVSHPVPAQMKVVITIGDATTEGFTVTVDAEFIP